MGPCRRPKFYPDSTSTNRTSRHWWPRHVCFFFLIKIKGGSKNNARLVVCFVDGELTDRFNLLLSSCMSEWRRCRDCSTGSQRTGKRAVDLQRRRRWPLKWSSMTGGLWHWPLGPDINIKGHELNTRKKTKKMEHKFRNDCSHRSDDSHQIAASRFVIKGLFQGKNGNMSGGKFKHAKAVGSVQRTIKERRCWWRIGASATRPLSVRHHFVLHQSVDSGVRIFGLNIANDSPTNRQILSRLNKTKQHHKNELLLYRYSNSRRWCNKR